jgi:excisionase family DNA binding protein
MTIQQAAQMLGLREKTIRRWVALRKIEYIKAGERAVRITSTEISRIIELGRNPRIEGRDLGAPKTGAPSVTDALPLCAGEGDYG